MENNNSKEANIPPTSENQKGKVTPADIKTPTGSRQDILNEFTRLAQEIEATQQIGRKKFNEFIKKKDIQATKALEPSLESDIGPEMPIDGDYVNGSRVFMRNCASCHSLEASNQGRNAVMGPALGLIYGKKAGSDKYFNYSDSYVHSQKYWTERFLFKYLQNPKAEFPDTKCLIKGGGLSEEGERADIAKFLRLFSKNLRINLENKAKKNFGKDYIQAYNQAQVKANESQYRNIRERNNN